MDWEPLRADHSIDTASVSIVLTQRLDPDAFDDLSYLGRKIAKESGFNDRIDALEPIELVPGKQQTIQLNATQNRRIIHRRLDQSNVPVDELHIAPNNLSFVTRRYQNWTTFYGLVGATLGAFNSVGGVMEKIRNVRLQYIDRFKSTTTDANHFHVIKEDSKFLTAPLRGQKNALHVHSGWFDYETTMIRRLTNVNIDSSEVDANSAPGERRNLVILTLAQVEAVTGSLDRPYERLDLLHDYLKLTLRDIITAEAANRIALT
jgi:uncharacterized protein (TIGR04255 family)